MSAYQSSRKDFFSNIKSLIHLCFGTGKFFTLTIISLVVTAIVTLLIPIALKYLIDAGLTEQFNTNLYMMFFVLVLMLAIGTATRYYSVSLTGELVYNRLRTQVFDHILGFSLYELDQIKTTDLLSRLLSDAEVVRDFTGSSLSIAARNTLLLIGGLAMMLHSGPTLTIIVLMIIPLVLIPVIILGRRLKFLSKQAQEKLAIANGIIDETLFGLTTLQNFNLEKNRSEYFKNATQTTYDISQNRIFLRAVLTFIIISLVFASVLGLLIYGSHAVQTQQMTAGELTQFILYAVFTAGATGSLSEVMGAAQKAQTSFERLTEILQKSYTITPPSVVHELTNPMMINFKDVSFRYPSRDDLILDHINLEIKPMQKIGLVGVSGAGKTTLLKLLMQEIRPISGELTINHRSVTQYNPCHIRKAITYVSQNVILFSDTIYNNIAYGCLGATAEQIFEAAKLAHIHQDIIKMENGYETHIGESGLKLSGGQRQKLAMARAILKNAQIWILDEPTSSLDSESEAMITTDIAKLTHDKTVIMISHDLHMLYSSDIIYVLENGQIIEKGTHLGLLSDKKTRYSQLIEQKIIAP